MENEIPISISARNNWINGLAHELVRASVNKYGTIEIGRLSDGEYTVVHQEYVERKGSCPRY